VRLVEDPVGTDTELQEASERATQALGSQGIQILAQPPQLFEDTLHNGAVKSFQVFERLGKKLDAEHHQSAPI
jgi:hypothetical protein